VTGSARCYVALGDSISIDEYAGGPGRGASSLLFRNDDVRFPDWSGRDLLSAGLADNLVLLARDGATSSDVVTTQLGLLRGLDAAPAAVTISMGGNDILAVFGDTRAARTAIKRARSNAESLLGALRGLMGSKVPIALATVYDPSDGSGDAAAIGFEPWPEVVELIGALNTALRGTALAHGVPVADLHTRFLGHGLSAGYPSQADAEPANRSLWYCGGVEPNAWGASEVRAAYWQALG
jgi:lysophospholipase L1-like esterase